MRSRIISRRENVREGEKNIDFDQWRSNIRVFCYFSSKKNIQFKYIFNKEIRLASYCLFPMLHFDVSLRVISIYSVYSKSEHSLRTQLNINTALPIKYFFTPLSSRSIKEPEVNVVLYNSTRRNYYNPVKKKKEKNRQI